MNWSLTFTGDSVLDILLISLSVFLVGTVIYRLFSNLWKNPRLEWEKQHKTDQLVLDALALVPTISLSDRKVSVKASLQRGLPDSGSGFLATKNVTFDLEDSLEGDFPEHELSRFVMVDWAKNRRELQDCHVLLDTLPFLTGAIPTHAEDEELSLPERMEFLQEILHQMYPGLPWKSNLNLDEQQTIDLFNQIGGIQEQVAQSHNALYSVILKIRDAVQGASSTPQEKIDKILELVGKIDGYSNPVEKTATGSEEIDPMNLECLIEKAEKVDSEQDLSLFWESVNSDWKDSLNPKSKRCQFRF